MNIIIGATGQLGHALATEHQLQGLPWVGSSRQVGLDFTDHWPVIGQVDLAKSLLTLEWLDLMRGAYDIRAVYYAAGETDVEYCENSGGYAATMVNVETPAMVASWCNRKAVRFVYYSSDYVFGEHGGPHSEEDAIGPINRYGESKALGEADVQLASPGALIVRTTGVYGPDPANKNFVDRLYHRLHEATSYAHIEKMGLAAHEKKPSIQIPFDQVSTPTYNADLARASMLLVKTKQGGIWNVAGPTMIDRVTFARQVAMTFGFDPALIESVATRDLGQAARRPFTGGLDCTKLHNFLGYELSTPAQGLLRMKGN